MPRDLKTGTITGPHALPCFTSSPSHGGTHAGFSILAETKVGR